MSPFRIDPNWYNETWLTERQPLKSRAAWSGMVAFLIAMVSLGR
jgi:hypothetical protein